MVRASTPSRSPLQPQFGGTAACCDLEKQPIEDPTPEWKEEDSPFQTVATIRAGRQGSCDTAQVQKLNEEMRLSPWIGLAAHRPLGNINSARKTTYEHSADYRVRFNRCPTHEPAGGDA